MRDGTAKQKTLPGRDPDGSKADQPYKLSVAWLNFACGAVAAGHRAEALEYVDQAIDHGYGPPIGSQLNPT
jgi:hypothetical protein